MNSQSSMLLEPGLVTETDGPDTSSPAIALEKANTAASACREWLEIVLFRIITSTRVTPHLEPLEIRAAVSQRGRPVFDDPNEVRIRGIAHHPRITGSVRFEWDTRIIDTESLRRIAERIGNGMFDYIHRRTLFMLETSADGTLWVRLCDSRRNPGPVRYCMGRGKMKPRPSMDYEK